MHPSLPHLLSDIEALINDPPPAPYYEVPPHMEEMPDMAELALSPFTTLEALTGISYEEFPPSFELTYEDWPALADAFKRLFIALNIDIIDLPDNFPDDAFIDQIIFHWDDTIQYLPLGGFEMEWCTGDNETCPYGDDCFLCGPDAPDPDDEEIPEPFIGGLFNDDGTRIDPLKVPIPDLCLRCRNYLSDDWEDNILCTLNRNDQKDSNEFECGSFEEGLSCDGS